MRWTALVALVAAVGLLGAGCGGEDSDDQTAAAMKDESGAAMKDESGAAMKDEGKMQGEATTQEAAMKSEAGASAARGKLVKAIGSQYGRVVADGKGEAFYIFDKESSAKSKCYGACAAAWPPVLTKGKPRAGKGVKASLLGTTKRANGKRQVTYDGQPLYYYVDDTPGNILCQNVSEFGGLWLVVRPGGAPVV